MVCPPLYKRRDLGSWRLGYSLGQDLSTGLLGNEAHVHNHSTLKLPQLHDLSDFSLGLSFPICKMGGLARSLRESSKPSLLCTLESLLNKRLTSLLPLVVGKTTFSLLQPLNWLLSLSLSRRDRNDDGFAVTGHLNQMKMRLSTSIASI